MTTFRRGAAALAAGFMVAAGATTTASAMPSENTNDPGYWEAVLMDPEGDFGFVDVNCEKVEDDYNASTWTADADYIAVILKAGSDVSTANGADEVIPFVLEGDVLEHYSLKDISHIIACTGDLPPEEPVDEPEEPIDEPEEPIDEPGEPVEEPEEPVEEPEEPTTPGKPGDDAGKPIGPIVQTDVPATGVNPALPLAAVAAAGLGLAAVGLRRRGDNGAS